MAQELNEFFTEVDDRYILLDRNFRAKNQELSFKLDCKSSERALKFGSVQCRIIVGAYLVFRFRLYKDDYFRNSVFNVLQALNVVNSSSTAGALKRAKGDQPYVYFHYSLDFGLFDRSSYKTVFLQTFFKVVERCYLLHDSLFSYKGEVENCPVWVDRILKQGYKTENTVENEESEESEEMVSEDLDEGSGKDSEDYDQESIDKFDLIVGEKELEIPKEIKALIAENQLEWDEIFDFNQIFCDLETNKYMYCPAHLLEHQLRKYPTSKSFLSNCENFFNLMASKILFFTQYPISTLIAQIANNEITSIILAPVNPTGSSKPLFSRDPKKNFNFCSKMLKNIKIRILSNSSIEHLNPQDYIIPSKLLNPSIENDKIGEGGFATVFKNSLNGKPIAIKIPHLKKEGLEESKERMQREFFISKKLVNPHFLKTFGVVLLEGSRSEVAKSEESQRKLEKLEKPRIGIVFEYLSGPNLKTYAKRMNGEEICRIMKKVAMGVNHMHQLGYIHQDLKPSNIMMRNDVPVIVDLGSAVEESKRSTVGGFTFDYADPDQLFNESPGKPADVWSFGLTFISLLLKQTPYGEIPDLVKREDEDKMNYRQKQDFNNKRREIMAEMIKSRALNPLKDSNKEIIAKIVPETVTALIEKCVSLNPKQRPTMEEILTVLETQFPD